MYETIVTFLKGLFSALVRRRATTVAATLPEGEELVEATKKRADGVEALGRVIKPVSDTPTAPNPGPAQPHSPPTQPGTPVQPPPVPQPPKPN